MSTQVSTDAEVTSIPEAAKHFHLSESGYLQALIVILLHDTKIPIPVSVVTNEARWNVFHDIGSCGEARMVEFRDTGVAPLFGFHREPESGRMHVPNASRHWVNTCAAGRLEYHFFLDALR